VYNISIPSGSTTPRLVPMSNPAPRALTMFIRSADKDIANGSDPAVKETTNMTMDRIPTAMAPEPTNAISREDLD